MDARSVYTVALGGFRICECAFEPALPSGGDYGMVSWLSMGAKGVGTWSCLRRLSILDPCRCLLKPS
ncbi:hypothetical protein Cob_v000683 [Colletotrichum orbiculare MAFF 240422]|uniref:Uncharacterized protein n=1 Tax=Colletotrichum orbiculare (strain 104-T / ATCC 96160 / CBS 514.97 / LARS 414 / MAFF 240422) TaxID=1213857 RepID=A0A484GAR9_COLOR|nr:hypothetical protein Cob_v000683 [Colletotrichum orbiculare MAFF 240422]